MPRKPSPDDVRRDLEQVLGEIRDSHPQAPVFLPDGTPLQYPKRYLIGDDGSLGPVSRLILMRCKLGDTAKNIKDDFKQACESKDLKSSNYTALQYAFSLTTTRLNRLPDTATLAEGMCVLLNRWRAEHGNAGAGLPPHPEPTLLFDKPFASSDACARFLDYLEYQQSPATQLASGRSLLSSPERVAILDKVGDEVVHGETMLINVHAQGQWDGLRAFSEQLAADLVQKEAARARSLAARASDSVQRDVLFVPLRANAIPVQARTGQQDVSLAADCDAPDEHIGLDRLMGILFEFAENGGGADVLGARPMTDASGFAKTLQQIRERLMSTARIIVFDGVYEAGSELAHSRKSVEKVIADEHHLFVIKRLMEPLLTSTTDACSLDEFYRNRFVITSNSDTIADSIWSHSRGAEGEFTRKPPLSELLRKPDTEDHERLLEGSLEFGKQVVTLLRRPGFEHCRDDVVNQLLNSTVSLLDDYLRPAGSAAVSDTHHLDLVVETFVEFLRRPDHGSANEGTVINALLLCLYRQSQAFSRKAEATDTVDVAKLWAELLLLLSLAPEGLTLETIERILMRLSMTHTDIAHPLPMLLRARADNQLDQQIIHFAELAASILGFIRQEFVEGPEVEDHPLESWEGLIDAGELRNDQRYKGKTLDFRYPEIRRALQRCGYWQSFEIDRCFLHRVISEVALQYQANFFRHTAYRHRGAVRYWRRLITTLYHGLASIGDPDLESHRDYGVRGADARGSSKDYWLFLYAKLYRQIMEQPKLWRISRIIGLNDLQTSLLELFSKPWLLLDYQETRENRLPRFIEHFHGRPQPAAEYYLARMRGALARGEVDAVDPGWSRRFSRIDPQPAAIDRLMMEYALLDLKVHTVESVDPMDVIGVLQDITHIEDEFATLEWMAFDPGTQKGLASGLPDVGRTPFSRVPGLMSLVPQDEVADLVQRMVDIAGSPALVTVALNYYGTLSRLDSDRADFADGYRHHKRIPDGLKASMRKKLETSLKLSEPECRKLRRRAIARLLLVEAARIALFRLDPTGVGFTRSKAQGRTAIRLALKLDDEFRQQLSLAHSRPSLYFRFARRMSDSCARMSWEYPRDQSYALVMETAMLRSESDRIMSVKQLESDDAALALRLLSAARSTIGRAERLLTTPNLASRAMLRMTLERFKLNRDLANLHDRCDEPALAKVYRQHADHDLNRLRGFIQYSDARPYWKLLVSLQRDLTRH